MGTKTTYIATNAVAAAVIGLCLMSPAITNAATLATSVLTVVPTGIAGASFGFNCSLVNVGSVPRTGTVEIREALSGTVLVASSYNVAPGRATGAAIDRTAAVSAYCTMTVDAVSGEKDSAAASAIRGSLLAEDPTGNTVANAEAR